MNTNPPRTKTGCACLCHARPASKPFVEYGPSSGPTLVPKGVPRPSAWAPVWYAVSGSLFVLFAVSVVDGHGWRAVTMLTAMLGASWLARSLTR